MIGARKKRRIRLIVAGLILLGAASILIGYGMRGGIEFFRSPAQILSDPPAEGERFRLGGLVKEGTWLRDGARHSFIITDLSAEFPVQYDGIVPDLFAEGQSTIVTGEIVDGVFIGDEVLAKHDEEYMPREIVDALKEQGLYRPEE